MSETEKQAEPELVEESKPVEAKEEAKPEEEDQVYGRTYKPKWFPKFENDLPSAEGKNVVITGTTSGTGLIAAKTSLKKGATVALLNRNEEKARKALEKFFAEHKGTEERAHFIQCDLQDFESVKNAAQEVTKLFESGIDVVTNNAGVMALEDKATKDGYDVQMQTNHLSHFLLTKELFPLLEKRAQEIGQARVVNHSSGARLVPSSLKAKYMQKDRSGKLGGNGNGMLTGGRWERYHQTKLANSVFTCELQKRCTKAGSKVIALCAHPGLAATQLQATTAKAGGMKGVNKFMRNAQSQEDGAMGLIKCMLDNKVKKGALYGPKLMTGKPKHLYHGAFTTAAAGKLLWRESEKAVGEFVIAASAPEVVPEATPIEKEA